jgi:hypothetical protein
MSDARVDMVDAFMRHWWADAADTQRQAAERGVRDAVVVVCDRADGLGRRLGDELAAPGGLGPADPDDQVTVLAVTPSAADTPLDPLGEKRVAVGEACERRRLGPFRRVHEGHAAANVHARAARVKAAVSTRYRSGDRSAQQQWGDAV